MNSDYYGPGLGLDGVSALAFYTGLNHIPSSPPPGQFGSPVGGELLRELKSLLLHLQVRRR